MSQQFIERPHDEDLGRSALSEALFCRPDLDAQIFLKKARLIPTAGNPFRRPRSTALAELDLMVEFKCHSLDTLSSRGRPFGGAFQPNTGSPPQIPQACWSIDFAFANELRRLTVDGRLEHFGALLVTAARTGARARVRLDAPRPPELTIWPEETVWNPGCYDSVRSSPTDGRKGPVVKALVAEVRYAVIEAFRAEGGSERFVLAYRNEHSLRDLVAAPCIAALGFSSREDAAARTKPSVSMATIQKQAPRTMVVKRTEVRQHGRHRGEQRSETCSASPTIRRFLAAFYSDVVAAGILIFSSSNIFSTAIRTFLAV